MEEKEKRKHTATKKEKKIMHHKWFGSIVSKE